MEYLHTDRSTDGRLRMIFNDRIVVVPIPANATVGAVAQLVCDLGPTRYGDPIAIDVRMPDASGRVPSFQLYPTGFRYEDDPIAEFEDLLPPNLGSFVPASSIQFNT